MKNDNNITIEDLIKNYRPSVWHIADLPSSNLTAVKLGTYAYQLQQLLTQNHISIDSIFADKSVLIDQQLEQVQSNMHDTELKYTIFQDDHEKTMLHLVKYADKDRLLRIWGEKKYNEKVDELERIANSPRIIHRFELIFWVQTKANSRAIILRDGYLLKCLNDSEIKSFDELEQYDAVFITQDGSEIASFVKFEKKTQKSTACVE